MIGQVFGQRTIIGEARPGPGGKRWKYRCACGHEGVAYPGQLRITQHCAKCNRGKAGRTWTSKMRARKPLAPPMAFKLDLLEVYERFPKLTIRRLAWDIGACRETLHVWLRQARQFREVAFERKGVA